MAHRKIIAILGILTCLIGGVIFVATPVFAKETACGVAGYYDPLICGYGEGANEIALQNRIRNILETIYLWIGIIAVIVIVIGGIRYMTSTGNATKVSGAKKTITYAMIGLIVTLAAFAITELVIGALNGDAPGDSVGTEDSTMVAPIERPDMTEKWQVTAVTISDNHLRIKIGTGVKLTAKAYPENAVDTSLTWSSTNEDVATVDQKGNVSTKKSGKVKIKATSRNNISAICSLVVVDPVKPVLNVPKKELFVGEKVTAKVEKNKRSVKWSSNNKSVFTVDANGVITAVKAGEATLKAVVYNEIDEKIELKTKIKVNNVNVLWVGNSKTYVNDIDQKFVAIAKNRGIKPNSTRISAGGATLEDNYIERSSKMNRYYDYLILQEQTDASIMENTFYNGALKVTNLVKKQNNNLKVFVRKTWYLSYSKSSANSVATNVANRLASATGLKVRTINDGDTLYELQDKGISVFGDDRHQNKTGAYAAGLCIAAKVLKIDPTTVTYAPGGISGSTLTTIKSVAKRNCYN